MNRKTKRTKNEANAVIPENQKAVAPKKPRQCEHAMSNGEFCRGVALRGRHYCFFHLSYVGRRLREARTHDQTRQFHFDECFMPMEIPLLEDANSIQIALTQVLNGLLRSRLDPKRAGLALYGLQIAQLNLANGVGLPSDEGATRAGQYDSFEEDYQLPKNMPELKADEAEQAEELPIKAAAPDVAKSPSAGKKRSSPADPLSRCERPVRPQFLEITPWQIEGRNSQTPAPAVASARPGAGPQPTQA